ncbi:MAG: efflux RND transporter periplasmic adaptor subunit, partial [Planctomycetales bacterium]|nr:efflux RND transporter periplasmic adaptor subunit [Planctomycetales bacterium]
KEGSESEQTNALAELTPQSIELGDEKIARAGIRTVSVSRQDLSLTRSLPAHFNYDQRHHVAVRTTADGVIEEITVKPGDSVDVGQLVARLRCPSVGDARSAVLKCQADLEIAETQSAWQQRICSGVSQLAASIRTGKSVEDIEKEAENAMLGQYRETLLAGYSKYALAEKLSQTATNSSGAVSGRLLTERQSEKQQARAVMEAGIEQSLFETEQQCKIAQSEVEAAARNLIVARQRLAALLGVSLSQLPSLDFSEGDERISLLEIHAPLAGTVEKNLFSQTERVDAGAELFVVADTTRLWVEADVRARDWNAMRCQPGDVVRVRAAEVDDTTDLHGRVYYVGREMDPDSGAIPLVIEVANDQSLFRPGMFARVDVPVGSIENAIAIPSSALIDVDGQPTVFIKDGNRFRPVVVSVGALGLGPESGEQIEVQSGLEVGQEIVFEGAFQLKSELLLESEA